MLSYFAYPKIQVEMKARLFFIVLALPVVLPAQVPFAPVGAEWGHFIQCAPANFPCAPGYPIYFTAAVVSDTIIQGKYCTIVPEGDWGVTSSISELPDFIVHQDGHQIYRYDREAEVFKLVLDFAKEVGESWQMEVPRMRTGLETDTLVLTVVEKSGTRRLINVNSTYYFDLYEGFGSIVPNRRLAFSPSWFYISHPFVWDELTCYTDPAEGLLYEGPMGCVPSHSVQVPSEPLEFRVYPNPANAEAILVYSKPLPAGRPAHLVLSGLSGHVVLKKPLWPSSAQESSFSVWELPEGLYFWQVLSDGVQVGAGQLIVAR